MNKLLCYYTGRRYTEECPLGSLRGLAEPGQGHQVVSYWTLNNMLNDMVITFRYAEDLGNVRLDVWGQRRRWRRKSEADSQRAWAVV